MKLRSAALVYYSTSSALLSSAADIKRFTRVREDLIQTGKKDSFQDSL